MLHLLVASTILIQSVIADTDGPNIPGCPSILTAGEEVQCVCSYPSPDNVAPWGWGGYTGCGLSGFDPCDPITPPDPDSIEIFCDPINLTDLTLAIRKVQAANLTVGSISVSQFSGKSNRDLRIPANYFRDLNVKPRRLSFSDCNGPEGTATGWQYVVFHPDSFSGLEESLTKLILTRCPVEIVPPMKDLQTLELLSIEKSLNLQEIPADAFSGLNSLKILNLNDNVIRRIHSGAFNEMYNLNHLLISDSSLDEITPYQFYGLRNVERLSLSRNRFRELPDYGFFGLEKLKDLDLRENTDLLGISDKAFIDPLEQLQSLNLSMTGISTLSARMLSSFPNLEELSLKNCELENIEQDVFRGNLKLRVLHLDGNTQLSSLPKYLFGPVEQSMEIVDLSETLLACDNEKLDYIRSFFTRSGPKGIQIIAARQHIDCEMVAQEDRAAVTETEDPNGSEILDMMSKLLKTFIKLIRENLD